MHVHRDAEEVFNVLRPARRRGRRPARRCCGRYGGRDDQSTAARPPTPASIGRWSRAQPRAKAGEDTADGRGRPRAPVVERRRRRGDGRVDRDLHRGRRLPARPPLDADSRLAHLLAGRRAPGTGRPRARRRRTRGRRLEGRRRTPSRPRRRGGTGPLRHPLLQHLPDPPNAGPRGSQPHTRHLLRGRGGDDGEAVPPAVRPGLPEPGALRRPRALPGFEADLEVDDRGLVLRYQHLFERVAPD
jgi:hypothetical protein